MIIDMLGLLVYHLLLKLLKVQPDQYQVKESGIVLDLYSAYAQMHR